MSNIQITSVTSPFDTTQLARQALQVITLADAMGLLNNLTITELNEDALRRVVDCLADAGIGQSARVELAAPKEKIDFGTILNRLDQALELSPVPEKEWPVLTTLFDAEELTALLGIALASLRRYRSGERATPDDVAARLHFLTSVVGYLAGSYNDYGIRRWFRRRRAQLDGKAPADLLVDGWDPADPRPRRIKDLAHALTGAGAT